MKPLTKEFIKNYKKQLNDVEKSTEKFTNYFRKVVDTVYECFNAPPPDSIWFLGAEEGEHGFPDLNNDNDVYYESYYLEEPYNSDITTKTYGYSESIPLEFLTMTLPKIRKYIEKEIEKDNPYISNEAKNLRDINKNIVYNAMKKLTQTEIDALKIYGLD